MRRKVILPKKKKRSSTRKSEVDKIDIIVGDPMSVDSKKSELNEQKRLNLNNQNLGSYVYSSSSTRERFKSTTPQEEVINLDD